MATTIFRFTYRVIALIVLTLLVTITHAQNVSPTTNYTGLDILFLVDQSGSMGGTRYGGDPIHGEGADILDLRFLGPQYALDWLSNYESTIVNNPPTIRYSLLTFGDTTRLLLDWTEIGAGQSWDATQTQITQDISADRFGEINLGYTDFQGAVRDAQDIFENAPILQPDEFHLNVIVLLTDGAPCVPQQGNLFPDCTTIPLTTQQAHLQGVGQFMQTNLPNTELYVIVLDQNSAFFPPLAGDWEQVVCTTTSNCTDVQLQQVQSEPELSSQFNFMLSDIVNNLSNAGSTQVVAFPPGTFDVPPYSQYVRVNVFKSSNQPLGNVSLLDPTGVAAPYASQGLDTAIETYEILLPNPGMWTIDLPNVDPDAVTNFVVSSDIIAAGAVPTNTPASVEMLAPVNLGVQIVDSAGSTLPYIGPPVPDLTVELSFYDATEIQQNNRRLLFTETLSLDSVNAPGINQFAGDVIFTEDVPHEVRVNAYYIDSAGQRQDLMFDETIIDEIAVNASYLNWRGLDPQSQRQSAPMNLGVDVRRTFDGELLDSVGDLALQVTLLNPDGTQQAPPTVYPNESTVPGQVDASLQFEQTGNQQLRAELGQVSADGTFVPLPLTDATRAFSYVVRPVTALDLEVTAPLTMESEVQGPFPYFWQPQPLTYRVELRDTADNALSLRQLTGDLEIAPALAVTRNGRSYSLDETLTEIRPGVYELETALPAGDYTFEAQVLTRPENFLGDFELQMSSVSQIHTRITAPWFYPTVIGLIVAVLLVCGLIVLFTLRELGRRSDESVNPIKGRLVIYMMEDGLAGPQTREIELTPFGKNRIALSRNELPGDFRSMVITNYGDPQSVSITVEEYQYGNETFKQQSPIPVDGEVQLHVDLEKNLSFNVQYAGGGYDDTGGVEFGGNDDPLL